MTIDTFKDNFWGPQGFDILEKRINQGRDSNNLFVYFLKERAAIEESYAKSLSKLLKHTSSVVEFGTLRETWLAMRGEIENLVRVHQELSDKIEKDIYIPFRKFKSETKKIRRDMCHEAYKINRERRDLDKTISNSRSKYEDYTKQAEKHQSELNSGSKSANEQSRLQSRCNKYTKEAASQEAEYKDCVNKWSTYQHSWEEKTQSVYNQLQATEEERVDTIKVHMDRYVQALSTSVIDSSTANKNLANLVDKIDKYEDINMFIAECKTGTEPPRAPSFVPAGTPGYKSEYTSSVSTSNMNSFSDTSSNFSDDNNNSNYNNNYSNSGASSGVSLSKSTQSTNKPSYNPPKSLTASNSSTSLKTTSSPVKPTPPAVAKRTFLKKKKMRALYEYVGSDATELDFYTGDVITVLGEDESGWWKGEIEGRTGLFPSNYTEVYDY
ncbi:SH3 domain-containing protein [Cavenderia fasciculata]|uniref:SH3 domain-containing protein n=1 Tax=Cavenderia fasciculata TaxID=261658 RepID=F4PJE6_CACFS|nr:SH3 domain-containing protein [Cavenderia fasciculata]EGG24432.1 SH3 domain-containing protein [Cavenderia fasciculata]|eukprot:XP_004362283.1 SH3 domain-containing protein [Cavenderia fasciculata]